MICKQQQSHALQNTAPIYANMKMKEFFGQKGALSETKKTKIGNTQKKIFSYITDLPG